MTIIKDCIYRFIELSDICKTFVDTQEFQRLRDIKQLGFVYLVYPSAVHTRFEHCLGVMHLAGKLIENLKEHGVTITHREKELVTLAALLHDIGHVASSHLVDYICKENNLLPPHEVRSIEIMKRINSRVGILSCDEEEQIGDMIMGKYEGKSKPFLYEIVNNSLCGIDVDRLDYLSRDAYHTGMPAFQPDYVLECTRVNDSGHLAFLSKSSDEICFMFETRSRMFKMVYRHKTVMKIERIIRDIISRSDISTYLTSDILSWLTLDDCVLSYILRKDKDYVKVYERKWGTEVLDKFLHCTEISKEEIEKRFNKVIFT